MRLEVVSERSSSVSRSVCVVSAKERASKKRTPTFTCTTPRFASSSAASSTHRRSQHGLAPRAPAPGPTNGLVSEAAAAVPANGLTGEPDVVAAAAAGSRLPPGKSASASETSDTMAARSSSASESRRNLSAE